MKIGLFDPSLMDNSGSHSSNLGDVIIFESVLKNLMDIFPNADFIRLSSHIHPTTREKALLNDCSYIFIAGTNILSSDINSYNQWKIMQGKYNRLFSKAPVKKVILFGVGWWQYQDLPTPNTRAFYKSTLSDLFVHSVRDAYTLNMLNKAGIINVVNTSCPTTWGLNGQKVNRQGGNEDCLFTLTDYCVDRDCDNALLQLICEYYKGRIFFFPQGNKDSQYLESLRAYKMNKAQIVIIDRNMEGFYECISSNSVDYIGTRLHAGIAALQKGINTVIIAVDNRAAEMGADISLPVIQRGDKESLIRWINKRVVFSNIHLPLTEIVNWKRQFVNDV